MDRRTKARELAMQVLYQMDVQGEDVLEHLDSFLIESGADDMVRGLAAKWTRGAWKELSDCDEMIRSASIKWNINRLCAVDKSILRLSVYQLQRCPEIPAKVVINEAIELAKKYSTAQSPGFVNGVLDSVMKKLDQGGVEKDKEAAN
ncbi:MAG: transcription antitermination factor NusB [Phycisphaerae bacterium]|nr:transcription antitermination factor NusB [Phycisphaerae bacterium]